MFPYDFEIKKIDNEYGLYFEDKAICIAQGDKKVKHKSYSLIEFIRDDFERCGEVSINENNSIDFKGIFCAYVIFSDQKNLLENPEHKKYQENISNLFIKYDMSFIRTANGPPYEMDQYARLKVIQDKVREISGKENYEKMFKYAWGAYYNTMTEGEDPGPGEFISDKDYSSSGITIKIKELYSKFSIEEKGAVHGLYQCLERQSILLPILLIAKKINISEYTRGFMGLGNNFIYAFEKDEDEDEKKNEENNKYQEIYNLGFNPASVALEYITKNINKKNDFKNSIENEIYDLIRNKETETVEFKETFNRDKKTQTKLLALEQVCFKTIAGFLNAKGGELLIGVSDNYIIVGIDQEVKDFHKNKIDEFLKYFSNKINNSFGAQIYPLVNWNVLNIENKHILKVSCKASDKEVYLNDEFYARTNPRTDKLEGKALVEYIKRRFK